jgi:hypothetical protein
MTAIYKASKMFLRLEWASEYNAQSYFEKTNEGRAVYLLQMSYTYLQS